MNILRTKQALLSATATFILLFNSCNEKKDENTFSYEQFKEALYYNSSTGEFADLGNLGMCINRWGMPEYVKSMGTMNQDGSNSRLNAIVFRWSNIEVDEKNVEIVFEAIPDSGKAIEDVFTNRIDRGMAKYLKVKEFSLVPISKP
ncbi:hypothetical protein [Aequorivita sinensis]|uniref:hypothetical protein n=1 Tax=Aequorivita sinensis TaxID=1382458 RepID=UPI0011242FCE|nr:hypothetical protein [Aequorivita sinensis]